ncbi:hypothetical protein PR202_gb02573 [Eleusine coracana subsp. coracana]|uniref:Uncharacterized protein n=1 Tax=Eleusine coracana subsp. coracana TaxID=191504 RepID=A0AAV5DY29_ELECO|nr:hypothetical protein PR202_gb02573 [Eleusine coracana subsp. coracana]
MERERGAAALWGHAHLPLLARAGSKESVEYILQALWRTRRTGLDYADRALARDILQLSDDADLDPLLVCLRILIRRCVNENVAKEDIPKLFPREVSPELQKLLTLLLQKFQSSGRKTLQRIRHLRCCRIRKQQMLQNGTDNAKDSVESGKREVKKFPLAKDSLDKMLKDLFPDKDQTPNPITFHRVNLKVKLVGLQCNLFPALATFP